jgi:iron complex transport system permease protein
MAITQKSKHQTQDTTRRAWIILIVLAAMLALSAVLSAGIGSVRIGPGEIARVIWHHLGGQVEVNSAFDSIIWGFRLPRVVLAILVGAALATAGALMQALFHNPMADPYIVGVSSGAAFGAVLVAALGINLVLWGFSLAPLAAFVGGLAVTFLVYALARRNGRVPIGVLLLTGIAVGGLMQAVTSFMLLRQSSADLRTIMSWLMGSLAQSGWHDVLALLPYVTIGLVMVAALQRDLNVLAMGDETAHHLGVNTERSKFLLLLVASLLAAAAVAVSGIIAFVGLIIPHLMRLIVGPNHRVLLPACLLCGGLLLVWADVIARTLIPAGELPIGIVTSVLGSPFFLYLLNRRETHTV